MNQASRGSRVVFGKEDHKYIYKRKRKVEKQFILTSVEKIK